MILGGTLDCRLITPSILLINQATLLTLAPLMVWTSYATALNLALLRMNPTGPPAAAIVAELSQPSQVSNG